jgi:hypothetical protein
MDWFVLLIKVNKMLPSQRKERERKWVDMSHAQDG